MRASAPPSLAESLKHDLFSITYYTGGLRPKVKCIRIDSRVSIEAGSTNNKRIFLRFKIKNINDPKQTKNNNRDKYAGLCKLDVCVSRFALAFRGRRLELKRLR